MKKLMTVIASVALAFGLQASGEKFVFNRTDFSGMPVGPFNVNMDDSGGEQGTLFWAGDAGDSEIKEAEDATKFLAIENSAPLFRTVNGQTADPQEIGTGVFADMYVKFTASDAADPVVLADGSKLGIWVAADDEADTPSTNLMVCAASLVNGEESPVATNFTIAVAGDFDFTAEHRVTIRAIEEISEGKLEMAGFVLYIDEELVAAADADYADKIGFTAFNSVAKPFYVNNQLFVSLVKAGTDAAQKITGVGFKGTGELSYVALADADHAPDFAKPAVDVTFAWGDGIKSFTYQGIATNVDAAGSVTVTLAGPTVPVTLSGVTASDGYVLGDIEAENLNEVEDGVWSFVEAPASLKMTAGEVAFTIGDQKFATFEDALAAAQPGDIIKLAKACAGWEKPIKIEDADVDVILDLNGETLTFEDYLDEDMFEVSAGKLTVIDSGNGGKIAVTVDAESAGFYGVFYADGDGIIQIGLDEGDNGVTVDGLVGDGLTILKGLFLKDENDQGDLENFIDEENYEVVDADDYWKVQKKGGPEPTTYTVSIVEGEGTVLTVTTEDGTLIEDGDPVDAGTELTITVEAEDGYKDAKVTVNGEELKGDTYTVNEDVEIASEATELDLWLVWIGDYDEDKVESFTANPMEVREDAEDKTITLTATFKEGFELDYYTVDGEKIDGDTFELDKAEVTVSVVAKATGGGWDPTVDPTVPASEKGIEGKLANASFKDLSTWAQTYGVDFKAGNMDEYADAFLLDCDPDGVEEAKKEFKFASITQDAEGNWVVVINNEELKGGQHFYGNGIAIVKRYSDVACETEADDGNFFKASLEVYSVKVGD